MKQPPISARATSGGFVYFPRMLDKIRKQARGELRDDYLQNLGTGFDGRMCRFLHVDYAALKAYVLTGASDEEALAWCRSHGRALAEEDAVVWNGFAAKRGWNDEAKAILDKYKAEAGMADRADIRTFFDFFEADENPR